MFTTRSPPALRVCLVEDSSLLLRTLTQSLREVCQVESVATAQSEEAAMRLLRAEPDAFDIVVIDIFLASGSGMGVLRAARVLQPGARLVMLTNYATLDVRKICVSQGADRIFDKSQQIEDFFSYCAKLAATP